VLPAVIGAERMADIIIQPEASDLLRSVGHESGRNAELEEFKFAAESPFVGRTVRDAEDESSVMVVALKREDGQQIFNPKDDVVLASGDIVIVMGPEAEIEGFYHACVDAEGQMVAV
jgi:voltage-gated potassium channel